MAKELSTENNSGGKITKLDELVGPLPNWAIREFMRRREILIDPLIIDGEQIPVDPEPDDWDELVESVSIQELSIDMHLGNVVKRFPITDAQRIIDLKHTPREKIDAMMQTEEYEPGQAILIQPGEMIVVPTLEKLSLPDDIVGRLEGKSSLARLGILVHNTAARFDPGWRNHPTLEIGSVLGRTGFLLYPGMRICSFTFERLAAPVEGGGYYRRDDRSFTGAKIPEVSNIHITGRGVRN